MNQDTPSHSRQKTKVSLIAFILLALFMTKVSEGKVLPPAPFSEYSEDKVYELKIIPNLDHGDGQKAKAVILKKSQTAYKEFLEVKLVNDSSPNQVYISNNGQMVTINDWYGIGYKHCVVIYDLKGKMLKDYTLEDILTTDEIRDHTGIASADGRGWLMTSSTSAELTRTEFEQYLKEEFHFTEDQTSCVIKTRWGKVFKFDLKTGDFKPK